ncbi:MAG: hypothetical protein K8R87_06840 [Verrucomicrobia bacterium]|nr:hypothetical protein [Verrucomicrobiota bacterium]
MMISSVIELSSRECSFLLAVDAGLKIFLWFILPSIAVGLMLVARGGTGPL